MKGSRIDIVYGFLCACVKGQGVRRESFVSELEAEQEILDQFSLNVVKGQIEIKYPTSSRLTKYNEVKLCAYESILVEPTSEWLRENYNRIVDIVSDLAILMEEVEQEINSNMSDEESHGYNWN